MTLTFGGGNRCGHDPHQFRRFKPPSHHHPAILEDARARIGDCLGDFWGALFGGHRQKRSERREACGILLSCLIHRMDLVTLRVGIPDNEQRMQGYSAKVLSRMTGLGLRRVERAMKDLVAMGIVTVYARSQKQEDGSFKGIAAIRTISIRFFDLIGLGKKVRKERKKASARRHELFLKVSSQKTFELMAKVINNTNESQTRERPTGPMAVLRALREQLGRSQAL
jgi:hypothetical protein